MGESKVDVDRIYGMLREKIIQLEYAPGELLNEVDLAEEFNISRTPIRKVFQMLQNIKLINLIPRLGAQVAPIDFRQMKYVFEITRKLEPFAAELAVERITDENIEKLEEIMTKIKSYKIDKDYQKAISEDEKFHNIIFMSCGNPWLEEMLLYLHYQTERLWHYCEEYFDDIELFSDTLDKILEAIKEKDAEKAAKYSELHIDEFVMRIKKELL